MFRTRLISGIVLVALALLLIITGGKVLLASTFVLSIIGSFELYRALGMEKTILAISGYLMTIFYYLNIEFGFVKNPVLYTIIFLIVVLGIYVFAYPRYNTLKALATFFGFFYVSVMLSFIYLTREIPTQGKYLVWLIFLCAWGSDTCAYCVGRLFGKHKMAPVLSPKKSIEGAVGGVVGAALLIMLYSFVLKDQMNLNTTGILALGVIGAIGALVSMVGDLAASAIKRDNDIKDYGKLIPGHGGVLDRFDSIIITAPIVFFLATYFVNNF